MWPAGALQAEGATNQGGDDHARGTSAKPEVNQNNPSIPPELTEDNGR